VFVVALLFVVAEDVEDVEVDTKQVGGRRRGTDGAGPDNHRAAGNQAADRRRAYPRPAHAGTFFHTNLLARTSLSLWLTR
jgi:hypothetical protein